MGCLQRSFARCGNPVSSFVDEVQSFSRPEPKVCTVFRNAGNMIVGQSVGVKVICLERLQAITVVTRQTVRSDRVPSFRWTGVLRRTGSPPTRWLVPELPGKVLTRTTIGRKYFSFASHPNYDGQR